MNVPWAEGLSGDCWQGRSPLLALGHLSQPLLAEKEAKSLGLEESPWRSPATPCFSEPPSWDVGRPNDSARLWGPSWDWLTGPNTCEIRQGWRAPGRPLSLSSGKQGNRHALLWSLGLKGYTSPLCFNSKRMLSLQSWPLGFTRL